MIIFGHSKHGKSFLGDTTPAPRVVLDAEGGSLFTPSRKTEWSPSTSPPPEPDGTWDTAIVRVRTYRDVQQAFQWLNSGKHSFRSVVMDSISEVQQRCVDDIAGTNQMQTQDWGQLLRVVSSLVRQFRDLTGHPTKPLDAVVFIAMAKQNGEGTWYPYVQGSLATTFPYYVDASTFLSVVTAEDGTQFRRLYCGTFNGYATGERLGGRIPPFIDNPNISGMLAMIRGEATVLPTTSSTVSTPVGTLDLNLNIDNREG
jgi:hypothetical protein